MSALRFVSPLPASAATAFAWHARPGAFERLTPPWDDVRIVSRTGDLRGGEVVLSIRQGPLRTTWVAQHSGFVEGREFVDAQVRGPFARWRHVDRFHARGETMCVLEDDIAYALPLAPLSGPAEPMVRRMLGRMFAYRHAVTRADLARHDMTRPRLRVAVTGASGLIGSALVPFLTTGGHEVVRLVRRPPRGADEHEWSPAHGLVSPESLGHVDAVIHLAGEGVASARWTPAVKARIRDSRVGPTARLAESLARLSRPPATFISASAIGLYGDRGDETLTEMSAAGTGFLSEVGVAWEEATRAAEDAGIRVVTPRIGVVIDRRGGALAKMLPAFRAGVGGRLGHGRQYFSWISLEDVLGALLFVLQHPAIRGPVNLTAPVPPTNAEFTATLGHVLRRPTLLSVPAVALRTIFGELARAELLSSKRVVPIALQQAGFHFLHPTLEAALRHTLGTNRLEPA
jgi:uncharacterized protein (TIGR01777 family)